MHFYFTFTLEKRCKMISFLPRVIGRVADLNPDPGNLFQSGSSFKIMSDPVFKICTDLDTVFLLYLLTKVILQYSNYQLYQLLCQKKRVKGEF